ncbi:MAG: hypothetical protein ACOYN0_07895 [Phycisphaerales bacterium]
MKPCALVVLLIAWAGSTAWAQQQTIRGVILTPVEQGVGDTDRLSVSLRVLRPDARMSTNFERVYEARLDPRVFGPQLAAGADQRFFVRFAGGVAAVFPQSQYVNYKGKTYAAIPPGTVYSVGGPIETLLGAPNFDSLARQRTAQSAQYVDRSARLPAGGAMHPEPKSDPLAKQARDPTPIARSIFVDELYRHDRLDVLMDVAVRSRKDR